MRFGGHRIWVARIERRMTVVRMMTVVVGAGGGAIFEGVYKRRVCGESQILIWTIEFGRRYAQRTGRTQIATGVGQITKLIGRTAAYEDTIWLIVLAVRQAIRQRIR